MDTDHRHNYGASNWQTLAGWPASLPAERFHTQQYKNTAGDVLAYLLEPLWALLLGVHGAVAAESPPKAAVRRKRQCIGNIGKAGNHGFVGAWAPLSARSGGMWCRRRYT